MEKRVQKILADLGIASRRKAEEMMTEGRVLVNGKPALPGMKADPERDTIKVDGKLITRGPEPKVYYAFHKPGEVMSTLSDPEGRATVKDFLKKIKLRVYPVGRLDYHSEGLLLLTNDGEFANTVLHPSKKISKTYLVKVKGVLEEEELRKLRTGVRLVDGMTQPAKVLPVKKTEANSWLEITIHEGRKRQVRRMLESVGHPVLKLIRTSIDGIKLGTLPPGQLRPLTEKEKEEIKRRSGYAKKTINRGGKQRPYTGGA
jgi:23S rRNA pseudouridine2605 synthase